MTVINKHTHTHIFLSIQTSAEILQIEEISCSKREPPFSLLHQLDGCLGLFLRLLLSTYSVPLGLISISIPHAAAPPSVF